MAWFGIIVKKRAVFLASLSDRFIFSPDGTFRIKHSRDAKKHKHKNAEIQVEGERDFPLNNLPIPFGQKVDIQNQGSDKKSGAFGHIAVVELANTGKDSRENNRNLRRFFLIRS